MPLDAFRRRASTHTVAVSTRYLADGSLELNLYLMHLKDITGTSALFLSKQRNQKLFRTKPMTHSDTHIDDTSV